MAVEAAAFPGHVESSINRFLNIAASLFENLSHLASHVARTVFLSLLENLGTAIDDLATARSGSESPTLESFRSGRTRS